MSKQLIIVLLFVTALIVFALKGLGKFIDLNLADLGVSDTQIRKLEAQMGDIVKLIGCKKGNISFLPSLGGSIEFDPKTFRVAKGSTFSIVNRDGISHKVGISSTNIVQEVDPTEFIEIDTKVLSGLGPWGITCDGINLGNKGPLLFLVEPY